MSTPLHSCCITNTCVSHVTPHTYRLTFTPNSTPTHSLAHSLNHQLPHSPTHSLTHSLTHHSLTHPLTHPLTHSPTHSLPPPPSLRLALKRSISEASSSRSLESEREQVQRDMEEAGGERRHQHLSAKQRRWVCECLCE